MKETIITTSEALRASLGVATVELVISLAILVIVVYLFKKIQDELHALGFDITPLGGGSYNVQGMPSGFDGAEPQRLLNDIVETLKSLGQGLDEELHHRMAMAMARNAAIPVGQVLSQSEMENLVSQLFQLSEPNYTPDGKAIVVIYPHENLEKMFK